MGLTVICERDLEDDVVDCYKDDFQEIQVNEYPGKPDLRRIQFTKQKNED